MFQTWSIASLLRSPKQHARHSIKIFAIFTWGDTKTCLEAEGWQTQMALGCLWHLAEGSQSVQRQKGRGWRLTRELGWADLELDKRVSCSMDPLGQAPWHSSLECSGKGYICNSMGSGRCESSGVFHKNMRSHTRLGTMRDSYQKHIYKKNYFISLFMTSLDYLQPWSPSPTQNSTCSHWWQHKSKTAS